MFELDRYGYSLDAGTGVWVRSDYQGIAYSDGDNSENELARIVREAQDVSVLSSELPLYCTDWPKLYHLTSSRGNIFRPFEHLLKGKSVLEIGAGCGAISRYLGEAGAMVLSLEGSPRRAAIAASRTRDLDTITVLAERFDDLKVEQQFDVVTLIGVLEYASMFSADADPAFGMLNRVRKLLKPDGHLFIAIENQLGLKYFAGAPEDHVGVPMYGIEGRYVDRQPKTFGRKELQALVARAGFKASDFLSPYPDYKIPNSIITERGFRSEDFDAAALACQNTRKDPQLPVNTTFNLERAWPVVIDNHLGMELANSFLVVASCLPEHVVPADILAYHYSTGRNAEYCKATVFVETPDGIEVRYHRLSSGTLPESPEDAHRFILPEAHGYAKGSLLSLKFFEAATTHDWNVATFTPFLSLYVESLEKLLAAEGHAIALDHVEARLPGHYIDAVAQNIILDSEGRPHLIDIEWEMVGGVELGHLLMRGLLLLIANAVPFHSTATMISRRDFIIQLLDSVGLTVTEDDLNRYAALEALFQERVTGREAASFLNWAPDATIQKTGSQINEMPKVATLYLGDAEGGFTEDRTKKQRVHDGFQTVIFEVPASARCASLRFDPINIRQSFSISAVKIYSANAERWTWYDSAESPLTAAGVTAFSSDANGTLFMALNDDPHVMLPVDLRKMVKGKSFKVQISFTLLTESEVAARLVQQEEELKQALETTSDQNLKEHSALEAIEAANLAEQENHRLALANIELENLSAQERHRLALMELETANATLQESHSLALTELETASETLQESHSRERMELEAANAALQESHSRALAELEAEKRAMQEAHQQEREALEAQNLAIQESYRLKLMEAESVHLAALEAHRSEVMGLKTDNLTLQENHHLTLTELEARQLAMQESHHLALTEFEAKHLALKESHHRELTRLEAETLALQQNQRREVTGLESKNVQMMEKHRLELEAKDTHIHNLDLHIMSMQSSHSWRITSPLRKLASAFRRTGSAVNSLPRIIRRGGGLFSTAGKAYRVWQARGLAGVIAQARWAKGDAIGNRNDYALWVEKYDTLDDAKIEVISGDIARWGDSPVISIIMPVYNPPLDLLREAVESVCAQLYPRWELCLADDASTDQEVIDYLKSLNAMDDRIKVVFREHNGHISAASNSALEMATGDFVVLMDNDDLLPRHALYWVARTIRENPDAGLIYSDEDKISTDGTRSSPHFKSDWNEFLFRSQNMVCHLGAYRRDLINEVGQFRVGFEGAQDYDLALRCIEKLQRSQIIHIPRVLYHWRIHAGSTAMAGDKKPYAALAGVKALDEHLQREGGIGTAELSALGMYRVHYTLPASLPLVTLVIPTRNAHTLVKQCIDSIKRLTTYAHYEIILVDNGSDDPESLAYFAQLEQEENIRVLRDEAPFNYSALNNAAVRIAKGELIGLVNNDIEVISPDWLSEMVSIALQENVGAVGARLWYPDNRLQHGGVIVGLGGVAGHSHKYLSKGAHGYFCRAELIQEFSAVTAACLVIKKSIFEELGGLDEEHLKVTFNDIDFCLRAREAGYLNVWTPFAELYHHESATRGHEDTPQKQARFSQEVHYMKSRWPQIQVDYAYSPNLTLDYEDFSLAWPPRIAT
ncbi:glycosyltransferase [Pseudomonas cannabina]|uniref:Glycosyltransferase n=1 Tax=Pseudomonas syringae pv. maculicola str. ES4326 TaxID=629265 RepID=A0A8T8BY69_PSEYM|nr:MULTISPECIES: glycosyltransferase [Pseudomonas syringae group]KPB74945.1 Group 2 family glycosyl transferase [Pseudomonas syringae pv. maculicola]QHE96026.1 glycosyltransferase [Pseudomonas syringae pv. maculicola str. ES4326]QQN23044.1 glycosyltransferase [Pseudomonas cannabina pv. alisalensis]UBY96679.1 glycosyltransferase [Pseudomonas cannabina pv. alisalensis]